MSVSFLFSSILFFPLSSSSGFFPPFSVSAQRGFQAHKTLQTNFLSLMNGKRSLNGALPRRQLWLLWRGVIRAKVQRGGGEGGAPSRLMGPSSQESIAPIGKIKKTAVKKRKTELLRPTALNSYGTLVTRRPFLPCVGKAQLHEQ